jgi:RNA polymerase sigma-70 factor (ECF subfamily)
VSGEVSVESMEIALPTAETGAREVVAAEASAMTARDAAARTAVAFEEAVGPHWSALVRRLTLVLDDAAAAEDVAQDAYLRAFRAWDRFDGSDVRAWLYTIALRLAFNEQRRHRRWLAAVVHTRHRPWDDAIDPDLRAALGRLDARMRTVLLLNTVDGYTQREIATMLAMPEGTVATLVTRARATLRADLDREA